MNLNLVADYDVCGKRFAASFAIHASQNLVALRDLTALNFPATDGGFVTIAATFLMMCESRRKAEAVEEQWKRDYKEQGRLYDFAPVDRYQLTRESEVKI